jgi:hypothetical protein
MTAFSSRKVCRIVYIMAALALGGMAAEARPAHEYREHQSRLSTFDGAWSVVVQADSGACDPGTYRYGVDIVNGAVTHEGSAYGRVSPDGMVRVELSLGEQHAEGVGRLSRTSGTGVWSGVGSAGTCSGRWFAERRPEWTSGQGR